LSKSVNNHRGGEIARPTVRGRGSNVDVLELIDRLERLVNAGTRVPLTSKAMVDEQEFLDIIDQLRVAVPEEIRQARRVSQDKDRVITAAQAEADKIIAAAQDQATLMLQESEVVRAAQQQASDIVADAEQRAVELRREADDYALTVLTGLDEELTKLLAQIRRGKKTLERLRGPEPANSDEDSTDDDER
jgi:hypothetical protein